MNKLIKTLLVISAVLIPIGIIVIAAAYLLGGRGFSMDSKFNIIQKREVFTYENMELETFDTIDIELSNAKVVIKEAETDIYGIKMRVEDFGKDPLIEVKNNCLYVENKSQGAFLNLSFGSVTQDLYDLYVEVYIPQGKEIKNVKAGSNNGSITITDLEIKEIDLKTSNGKLNLKNIVCDNVKGKTSNGAVNIEDSKINELQIKTSNGRIEVQGSFEGNVDLKTSNGSIEFKTEQEKDYYDIDMDTSNGSIRVDGDKVDDDYRENNKSDYNLKLKTSNGSISAYFEQ